MIEWPDDRDGLDVTDVRQVARAKQSARFVSWLKARIEANVQAAVGGTAADLEEYREPAGDPGLLGPDSPAWVVHGDLAGMLYGGFGALMLQTLHPRAMAGVAQHSNYRNDPTGRLIRTARFVAGTTFGPTTFVDQLFAEVLHVHSYVNGVTADGEPYSANDPDLLTWVHVTEVRHFFLAYQRYGPGTLRHEDEDRYFADTAKIPLRLGAGSAPTSRAAIDQYVSSMRPVLRATPEALDAVRFLSSTSLPTGQGFFMTRANRLAHRIVVGAAIDLLPDFARAELGIERWSRLKAPFRRAGGHLFGWLLRWALGPSRVAVISANRIARGTALGGGALGGAEISNEADSA